MVVSDVMRTALVTGGAGFLGTAVVSALESAGYRVVVAGTGSVTDPLTPAALVTALEVSPELVVHCAGSSSVAASVADPDRERAKTVVPFRDLLAQVRRQAPESGVVLVSSAAVYGNATRVPTPETEPLAPLSPYGQDKRACEQLCLAHGAAGHDAAIVRLFSVYGKGLRKQLLWDACTKTQTGAPMFGGTGDEERDWLHVSDAAALIVAVAAKATPSVPVFNGGAGHGVTVRHITDEVSRAFDGPPARFSGDVRPGDPRRYIADIGRARALGWSPKVPLATGIAEYIDWFRSL
jgi:UDP-glucose 4-epimerase